MKVGFFIDWFEKIKLKNLKLNCAYDQKFSPLLISDFSNILNFFIKNDVKGIINVGGPEQYTRLECLNIFLKKMKKNDYFIKEMSINDFKNNENLPLNTSFDINYLESLINFNLTSFEEALDIYINEES